MNLRAGALVFFFSFISIFIQAQQNEVVGFVYHRFGEAKYPSTNISKDLFEQHISYLSENDYVFLTFSQALDKTREKDTGKKYVCITVDDGYQSFYEVALPILKKYNATATVFVNSETAGKGTYMDWSTIQRCIAQGIEIGNHSHAHPHFIKGDSTMFAEDLQLSQSLFQKNIDYTPIVYAYPYGEWNDQMKSILLKNKFKGAAAQNSGVMSACSDLFAMPRFPMAGVFTQLDKFQSKAKMQALCVKIQGKESHIIQRNPPSVTLKIDLEQINFHSLQCFIDGSPLTLDKEMLKKGIVTIKAEKPLQGRRSLYTLTAQDKSTGKWRWYSYLWINDSENE